MMAKLEAQMPFTRPDINHVFARQVPQILVPEIQQALLGQKTPQQALTDGETAVNAMLERGR
jgi:ABC-type glycerol-3-phosphate transport system substrate-binding protein